MFFEYFDLKAVILAQDLDVINFLPLVAVGVFVLVLICGLFVWRNMFSTPKDYASKFDQSLRQNRPNDDSLDNSSPVLEQKRFASADTVENNSDEDVVDNLNRMLSKQPTVDATEDVSVLVDEDQQEELQKENFSSSPTVDSTGDVSVSTDDEQE